MKDLKDQHSLALDKILTLQNQLSQLEHDKRAAQKEVLNVQHQLASKDSLVKQQKQDLDRLQVNEDVLASTIRSEFEQALEAKERAVVQFQDLVSTYQQQLHATKQRHEQQIQGIYNEKEAYMQQVEEKIKEALLLKDNQIQGLKEKLEDASIKVHHLESLIEKQRMVYPFKLGIFTKLIQLMNKILYLLNSIVNETFLWQA